MKPYIRLAPGKKLSVLIVEEEAASRVMLSALLEGNGFDVVGVVSSAISAMNIRLKIRPQVVVLGIEFKSGRNGIELAHALRKINPRLGIVFLSSVHDARTLGPNQLKLPAESKYINKANLTNPEQIYIAIRDAYTDANVGLPGDEPEIMLKDEPFTDGQMELMRQVASGMSNRKISTQRYITEKSVENSISRLAKKMHIRSDTDHNQRVLMAKSFFKVNH
jgi:DNA-binding NarL/FixJ family response regulator